ncbi:MAG: hypothetical protein HY000_00510 [Planctomycetes bacterium]|nr:hypothetical protein [Planctomycetota bacterium]
MDIPRFLMPLACVALMAFPSWAADLTKIDRKIAKEPAYRAQPKYCLLVFGPEARTRVWLVLDGDALYVDRNSNGDLTEDGERVAAKKGESSDTEQGSLSFEVGEFRDGPLTHKSLTVGVGKLDYLADREEQVKEYLAADPQARGYTVSVEVEVPGWNGAGIGGRVQQIAFFLDARGFLKFADKREDAPIIHFGGPWQVTLFGRHKLTVGRQADFVLGVGTPGIGPGTTAYVGYEGVIPEKVYPTVEIAYPPVREGAEPAKEQYELKGRC